MKIGVFDSGIGGQSVATAIARAYPEHQVIFRNDQEHLPYGNKPPEELMSLVTPIMHSLINDGCQLIVIACNTVSTTLVTDLRAHFAVPFVALEPMVKPAAALTKSGVIAICATPTTLQSKRYAWLKHEFAQGITVLEPDCSDWAAMIEHNEIDNAKISSRVNEVLDKSADVIVLACTHYHWIEADIKRLAEGRAIVLQPETAIVNQVATVIAEHERQP